MAGETPNGAPTTDMMSGALSTASPTVNATIQPSADTPQQMSLPSNPMPAPQSSSNSGDSGGFLSHIFSPIKHFGQAIADHAGDAAKDTTYNVDNAGNLAAVATNAAPGTLFKHLLVGALSGLGAAAQRPGLGFGGAAGVGAEAGMNVAQQADEKARQDAIQQAQLKRQAQQAEDQHNAAKDESALRSAEVAHNNALTADLTVNALRTSQDMQDKAFEIGKDARNYLTSNGGTVTKSGVTYQEYQQMAAADKSMTHSLHAYLVGEAPALDANGDPIMENATDASGNPLFDAKTGKPVQRPKMEYRFDVVQTPDDHTLTKQDVDRYSKAELPGFDKNTVKAGQTISGARWFNLENQYNSKQIQDWKLKAQKAEADEREATAAAERTRASSLAEDIKDKKLARQAKDDWGVALTQNNNDPQKAVQWMKDQAASKEGAHFGQSLSALAAAESMDIASTGETDTETSADGTTKTVIKKKRLFSTPPVQQKVTMTGPQGTFQVDADKVDMFKQNGYSVVQQGGTAQSATQQPTGHAVQPEFVLHSSAT